MKAQPRPLRMGDLITGRRRSVFDATPVIDRLNLELQRLEILEEAPLEAGRVFPLVTNAFMQGHHTQKLFDGSFAPILIVRLPTPVDDRDEWAKRCKTWERPLSTVDMPDLEDDDPGDR